MDGLSSAASIIAVIQITSTLISLGNDYIGAVKRASDDIRDLTQELVALKQVLVILQDYASRNPQSIAFQKLSVKDGPLQKCAVELSRLRLKLEPKTGLKGMIKSLTWPFNQTETMQNIARIERHKSLFSLALAADHMWVNQSIFYTFSVISMDYFMNNTDIIVDPYPTQLKPIHKIRMLQCRKLKRTLRIQLLVFRI